MPEHKKPEKKDNLICRTDRDMLDDKEIDGFNQACDDWQAYHNEKLIKTGEDMLNTCETHGVFVARAMLEEEKMKWQKN